MSDLIHLLRDHRTNNIHSPFSFFVLINFLAFLAGSNISYAFLDMVRPFFQNGITPTPKTFTQTSPAVGISFCLIIVRLGAVSPEVREDSWESSQRSRASGIISNSRVSRLPVALDRVKVERDVYVSECEGGLDFMMSSISPKEKPAPVH